MTLVGFSCPARAPCGRAPQALVGDPLLRYLPVLVWKCKASQGNALCLIGDSSVVSHPSHSRSPSRVAPPRLSDRQPTPFPSPTGSRRQKPLIQASKCGSSALCSVADRPTFTASGRPSRSHTICLLAVAIAKPDSPMCVPGGFSGIEYAPRAKFSIWIFEKVLNCQIHGSRRAAFWAPWAGNEAFFGGAFS